MGSPPRLPGHPPSFTTGRSVEIARKNLLDAYASLQIARATKRWQTGHGGSPSVETVEFDPLELRKTWKRWVTERRDVRQLFAHLPTHFVWYEDLVAEYETNMRAILAFLGVQEAGTVPRPETMKQEQRPLREVFSNWDVVDRTLRGTDWEGCLHGAPPEWQ